jgi:hypothetical protein
MGWPPLITPLLGALAPTPLPLGALAHARFLGRPLSSTTCAVRALCGGACPPPGLSGRGPEPLPPARCVRFVGALAPTPPPKGALAPFGNPQVRRPSLASRPAAHAPRRREREWPVVLVPATAQLRATSFRVFRGPGFRGHRAPKVLLPGSRRGAGNAPPRPRRRACSDAASALAGVGFGGVQRGPRPLGGGSKGASAPLGRGAGRQRTLRGCPRHLQTSEHRLGKT